MDILITLVAKTRESFRPYREKIPEKHVSAFNWTVLTLLIYVLAINASTAASPILEAEYRIKAAYLYRFCDYVEWPEAAFESPQNPLVIGVLGADQMVGQLEEIVAGRSYRGRPIEVTRLHAGDAFTGVHVLFIGRTQIDNIDAILPAGHSQPILTVTESNEIALSGIVINFVVIGDRVRFDVALKAARRSNLRINSRLLSVARNVINEAS